jgi:hypothetical protein
MRDHLFEFLQSRNGMIAVLAALAATLLILIFVPLFSIVFESNTKINELTHRISDYRAMSSTIPVLETELRRGRIEAAQVPTFIFSENPELAAAQLEVAMKNIVQTNDGHIQSARIFPPSTESGLNTVSVQYDFSIASDHFQNLVYAIETHIPYFFVDDVTIHGNGAASPTSGAARPESVEIEWTIHAFQLGASK